MSLFCAVTISGHPLVTKVARAGSPLGTLVQDPEDAALVDRRFANDVEPIRESLAARWTSGHWKTLKASRHH
jgi:hypothetical protein